MQSPAPASSRDMHWAMYRPTLAQTRSFHPSVGIGHGEWCELLLNEKAQGQGQRYGKDGEGRADSREVAVVPAVGVDLP